MSHRGIDLAIKILKELLKNNNNSGLKISTIATPRWL